MEWNRSETIALAKHSCTLCHGSGLRSSWGTTIVPCNCVLRAIFRACYARFRHCVESEECLTQKSFEYLPSSGETAVMYDRKNEEYAADFVLIAKRHLDERDLKLFRYHFLLGADWKLCCAKLGTDRGSFFHAVYRIQQKLGKAFRETQPYPLFPVYEYFDETRQPVASSVANPQQDTLVPTGRRVLRVLPKADNQPYPDHQGNPGKEDPSRQRKIA